MPYGSLMGLARMKEYVDVKRGVDFLRTDIWRLRLKSLPKKKSFLVRQLRVILLAIRGFTKDRCNLRASALTFYFLLSIVPAVAMAFGIAKGFGLEKLLQKSLMEKFQGQEEVVTNVIAFAHRMLEKTKGGLIAGIGLLTLFWLVIKLLSNIEVSFNEIWGVRRARPLLRKFSDYLSVMLIYPILFISASSTTVFVSSQVTRFTKKIALLGKFSSLILFSLKALPLIVLWCLFTFINMFMPNTKVSWKSGLAGGIIAGTVFQLVQWAYIRFQIGVAKYGAIYGSFAALPLFLVWLQMSWLIVLFGAEISFAVQNVDAYEFEPDCLNVKPSFKKLLSLRIVNICVKRFCNKEDAWSAKQIASFLDVPIRLVNMIVSDLVGGKILAELRPENDNNEELYQPALDVSEITVGFVLRALDSVGTDDIPVEETEELRTLSGALDKFWELMDGSEANLLLKNV